MKIFFHNYHGLRSAYDLSNTVSLYLGENEGRLAVVLEENDKTQRFIHVNEATYADSEIRWHALLDVLDVCIECFEANENRWAYGTEKPIFAREALPEQ